jgi:hypothetical protein
MSPVPNAPIDYSAPVFVTSGLTWTSGPLAVAGTWGFGVRAANQWGEEQNLDASVYVTFDSQGNDITNRPSAPTNLRAFPVAGAKIKIEWAAGPASTPAKRVTSFAVYMTAGPHVSYGAAAQIVQANGAIAGVYQDTQQGIDGQLYTIGVRASNASGTEHNMITVQATADGTGPGPVSGLTLTPVP